MAYFYNIDAKNVVRLLWELGITRTSKPQLNRGAADALGHKWVNLYEAYLAKNGVRWENGPLQAVVKRVEDKERKARTYAHKRRVVESMREQIRLAETHLARNKATLKVLEAELETLK